jgi:competence protein ComEC
MGGIFLRSFFDGGGYEVALCVVIGCAALIAHRLIRAHAGSFMVLMGIAAFSLACGAWRMDTAARSGSVLEPYESERVMFEARVAREPETRDTRVHLYVTPIGFPDTHERILVVVDRFAEGLGDIGYGDELTVTGTLMRPEAFATDGGRTFDYPGYLRARSVQYRTSDAAITKIRDGDPTFMRQLLAGKQALQTALEDALPQPMASLGEGVLLGVRGVLGDDLERAFRVTGIIHIVVLSGYNVMIIVEWLTYVLSFAFALRMRTVIGIAAVVVFVAMVGASATAVRAGIMASLLLCARGMGRTYAVMRALMLAAVVMLILDPYLLVHDPGFQLSFLATLGLIVLSPRMERHTSRVPERFGMRTIFTATIATQIFVLPLLLYQTGIFSVVALIVNMLVLPAVPVAMLLTFLTGIAGLFSPLAGLIVGSAASVSLAYILKIAVLFAQLPFASFSIGAFPFWMVGVSYLILAAYLIRSSHGRNPREEEYDLSSWTIEAENENQEGIVRTAS